MYSVLHTDAQSKDVLCRLAGEGLDDIYYSPGYIHLYTDAENTYESFLFEQGNDFLFFPYIKTAVPGHDGLYDFQTAYGYGGPVANTEDPVFLGEAWKAFTVHAEEQKLIAGLVRFHPLLDTRKYAEGSPLRLIRDRETIFLSLDRPFDEVWNEFGSDNKRKIRKGEKEGVTVTGHTGIDALMDFSTIYLTRMEELEAHDSYMFNEDYFRRIHNLGKGSYRVYRADHDGKMIGGALVLFSDRFAHYHLSASSREFFKLAPNNMLRYGVIKDLLGGPQEALHFGGGKTSSPDDTLLAFKSKFSKQRAWFYIGTCVLNRAIHDEVCAEWENNNPHKVAGFGKYVLKYRF